MRALFRSQTRSYVDLHNIDGPEEDDGCEQSIHVLVERRVLKVVIISGDKDAERNEEEAEEEAEATVNVGTAKGLVILRKNVISKRQIYKEKR